MKYYSELTKKLYDNKEDLTAAEVEVTKSKANRAEKAKEVTELIKKANEATKEANKALSEFIKEYGSFKTTIKDTDGSRFNFWSIFDEMFF